MTVTSCTKYGLLMAVILSSGLLSGSLQAAAQDTAANDSSVSLKRWLNHYVENHPAVLAAQSAVDSAGYQLVAADKALFNPELELDAETAETNSAYIGLSQTIDWGDIRGARTERATSEQSAAQLAYESSRRDIASQLLTALADYHTTVALKELAEQGNSLMRRSAKLAKQRFDAGDLGQVEVDLANLSYAQARFQLADAISAQARAKQELIALTGNAENRWPELAVDFPAPDRDRKKIDKTVQQLPQMREIIARVHAAQAQVKVRAGQTAANPTLAFRAGKEEQDALLGVSFSIPLQVRNNFQAEVDAANAQMIQAEKESIDAYRQLKSRLEIAAVSYELSREAWQAWQRSGEGTLGEQIKLLERLWKAGEINTTDYLIQLTQALSTKASALEQRGRMWTDWSEWLLASGQIKQWLAMQAQDQKQSQP